MKTCEATRKQTSQNDIGRDHSHAFVIGFGSDLLSRKDFITPTPKQKQRIRVAPSELLD